jgi:hypothetical protein
VPGGDVVLRFEGPCVSPVRRELQVDTGTYTLNAGEIRALPGWTECEIVVTVTRTVVSTDKRSTLAGFYARLESVATASIQSTP